MNRILHSRACTIIAAIIAAIGAFVFDHLSQAPYPLGELGLIKGWSSMWIESRALNLILGLIFNYGIALMIIDMVRRHNLLRSMTMLPATLFIFMQLATPILFIFLSTGLVLCAGVMACMLLMYDAYNDLRSTRNIFLTFFIISAGSTFDYGFLVYLPVFLLALAQMRVLNVRGILAMLMGLATPWIILFGFGIVAADDLQWPMFASLSLPFATLTGTTFLATGALTCFVGIAAWVQNIVKIISYNARSRALLSLVTVVMYVTILATLIDFKHLVAFLPIINVCAALQIGHLFGVIYTMKKAYIAMLSIMGLYFLIFTWRMVICVL